MINDTGTVGCGFICERFLEELLGSGAAAKITIGIQVMIHVTMGLFKGVLVRKFIACGPSIQLNQSLQKILSSRNEDSNDDRYLVNSDKKNFPQQYKCASR
jgi:hypothetical protein